MRLTDFTPEQKAERNRMLTRERARHKMAEMGVTKKEKACKKCNKMFKPNSNRHLTCSKCNPRHLAPLVVPAKSKEDKILDQMEFTRSRVSEGWY